MPDVQRPGPMRKELKVLIVEDVVADAELMTRVLREAGIAVVAKRVQTEADMRPALSEFAPDIVLSDYNLPGFGGLESLALVRKERPEIPFVFVSGSIGDEQAIDTVKRGARDYVLKDNLKRLPHALRRALEEAAQRGARARAEVALRESDARNRLLAMLVEQSSDGIFSKDLNGVVTSWNQGAASLYGFTAEEAIGTSLRKLQHAHLTDEEYEQVLARIRLGKPQSLDAKRSTKSGALVDVMLTTTPLFDAQGTHIGEMTVVRDITERKRAEQEIREINAALERRVAERTRELEQANRAKSDFLASMSHELRTPMNAIIGFSEALKDGLLGELTVEQKSPVEDIFSSATHLLLLINDILDLSKVDAGKMALELEAVKPRELLEASLVIVREQAMRRGIKLALEVPEPLPELALDPRRAKQILLNLLANAVNFTGKGGAVSLAARRAGHGEVRGHIAPEGRTFGEFLEIAVRDTGAGMTKEDMGRLFQPFVQLDSSLARRHEGTGLGLAMVQRLASLHGGAVWVESEPGKGSTFTVWLPWRTAQAAPAMQLAASAAVAMTGSAITAGTAPAAAPARVLLVEDDPKAVALLRGELEREGVSVEVAATGTAALEMARAEPPDLVTLDLLLPDMDGWDLLARLKAEPRLANVPVVILSVVADEKRGIAMGAVRVLQKPVPRDAFIAEVRRALAGRGKRIA